ncbi:TetR/AcrR family transcriptional regulator [Paenibacillus amylolyticus]|uniref:TetR/AcrR family transcriptional regulator n=1 Tax=Paenibacillus amylolyticus TaxID=1451 RepID=UPI00105A6ABB|nr:TetR/AcrR family transcriptional regulator [Paenibacillus amylolyticus]TDL69353.1 TetR/AcrR family transcriptional regulator [Paenibacillus amylolyticus]
MTNKNTRNTFVKLQITNSLLDMLKTKELRTISVSDLTSHAKVSRVSFYRNYREKEDILKEYLYKLIGDWHVEYQESQNTSEEDMLGSLFEHFSEQREFYLLLSKRNMFYLLKDVLKELYGPKPDYPNFGAYVAAYFSYGLFGWIEEWFARGMQESSEEMTFLLKNRNKTET